MAEKNTFARYEYKYSLTPKQYEAVMDGMQDYMRPDEHGPGVVRSVYYDTPDYRMIRRSLEKPAYKEKLRIRSYHTAGPEDMIFLEMKRKCEGLVYKRRIDLPEGQVTECLKTGELLPVASQIGNELEYFRRFYGVVMPSCYISCQREAWYAKDDGGFRVTFDSDIRGRMQDLSLREEPGGILLLEHERRLMEIKIETAMPLWMCRLLSNNEIRRTSYSKYGTAYRVLKGGQKLYTNNNEREGQNNADFQRAI